MDTLKQNVEAGEDRILAELGVPTRTLNVVKCGGPHVDAPRIPIPMLSHVVGKCGWDADDYEERLRGLGKTGLLQLMAILNKHGFAMGSPAGNRELATLPISTETKWWLRRGGMVYIDHVTDKTESEVELALWHYQVPTDKRPAVMAELKTIFRGVGLEFKEPVPLDRPHNF